jgi:acyl-CoA synthetase (AMP-forming)/AMP-acid ligase II
MAYWQLERHPPGAPALLADDGTIGYGDLAARADAAIASLPAGRRTVGVLVFTPEIAAVALFLGCLRSGRHVALPVGEDLDPGLLDALLAHYRPEWVALPAARAVPAGYRQSAMLDGLVIATRGDVAAAAPPADALALLLSTSGSTGSPKLVRLGHAAIAANATSIVEYLGLRPADRAITTLPLSYSFGLSILASHLDVGASLVLTRRTMLEREFWAQVDATGVTSLSGVPATFELLARLGLERRTLPSLRMLTQAGGRLRDDLIRRYDALARERGWTFWVMYGQTEAAPRISYVPPARLADKVGSIGIAVPGGTLAVDAETGELIYRGPNVMLGYAERRDDLALGDTQGGVLRTGDLARIDDDGYAYLTGRARRFVKLSGVRIGLDEVEHLLAADLDRPVAATGADERLVVAVAGEPAADADAVRRILQLRLHVHPGLVRILTPATLPLKATGKVDYQALDNTPPADQNR